MSEESLFVARVDEERCVDCGFCRGPLYCPSRQACIGCGVCVQGCPYQAREMAPDDRPRSTINVTVNGRSLSVPERITVKLAVELAGLRFGISWEEGDVPAPCGTGGCYSCVVLADGQAVRACVSPVREGMAIETALPAEYVPRRIIHGPRGTPSAARLLPGG